jgi:hypothetical protein
MKKTRPGWLFLALVTALSACAASSGEGVKDPDRIAKANTTSLATSGYAATLRARRSITR